MPVQGFHILALRCLAIGQLWQDSLGYWEACHPVMAAPARSSIFRFGLPKGQLKVMRVDLQLLLEYMQLDAQLTRGQSTVLAVASLASCLKG